MPCAAVRHRPSIVRHSIVRASLLFVLVSPRGGALRVLAEEGGASPGARAVFSVSEQSTEEGPPLPCRIHLQDAAGRAVKPKSVPSWNDHFVCNGTATVAVEPGSYRYEIERGPEYRSIRGALSVERGQERAVKAELERITHLTEEGWWSGETHVHRPVGDVELLMRAEDLHVSVVTTWWNNRNPWRSRRPPAKRPVRFDTNRLYDPVGGEDERGGGALLYFSLPEPLPIAGSAREFPASVAWLQKAKAAGGWVDAEKPFWWDFPAWLASGHIDSVGICHNHMQRSGVLDSEAWGRPRDRGRYPGAHGNGLWTQDIYYHALDCGLRVPPSAGSASGVLANPVGYNRLYVHLDGDLTWDGWWKALAAGRVFVTNGPLLRVRADGELPGHVFRSGEPLQVTIDGKLDSRDPIAALELVQNGHVERVSLPAVVRLAESGWFLVRAIADVEETFRFASTGPWYVEIGEAPRRVSRRSAEFFVQWTRERLARVRDALKDPEERLAVLKVHEEAERYWREVLGRATAP